MATFPKNHVVDYRKVLRGNCGSQDKVTKSSEGNYV